jgi:predicted Zn-dependent protease
VDLDLEAGREAEALAVLDDLHRAFPGNHAIAVQYGEALLRSRDPQPAAAAARILRQQLLTRGDDPWLHELAARAASIAGDDVRASEDLAESYFHRGSVQEAIEQLEMLSDRDDLDYYERARVTARLEEMRVILRDFDVAEGDEEETG